MIRIKNTLNLGRLPSEYQELDYIQSTGTQWIDTGYTPVKNDELEIKNVICKQHTTATQTIFSAGTGTYQWVLVIAQTSNNVNKIAWYRYCGTSAVEISNSYNLNTAKTVVSNSTGLYFGGTKVGNSSYAGVPNTTIRLLMRANDLEPGSAQIGEVTIRNGDTLKRNMIPCYRRSDNAVGMYDLVNGTFYTNAGSGTFLMGNEVSKRDININPAIFNLKSPRGYIQDKLFYGEAPQSYEQLVNYTMLYDRGDDCTSVVGGWSGTTYYTSAKFTKYSDYMHLHSYRATAYTQSKVNLTGHSKMLLVTETRGRNSTTYKSQIIHVANSISTKTGYMNSTRDTVFSANVNTTVGANYNFLIDIASEFQTSKHIGIMSDDADCNAYINIYNFAIFKEDDWQTLANLAGISANSISDILTNSSKLLSSKSAVEFMIKQCTGSFMVSAVLNQTFLTALINSAYRTIIYANEHWSKFLSMMGYSSGESVEIEFIESIVPTDWEKVSSNEYTATNEYGKWVISSSGHTGSACPVNSAFDSGDSTYWWSEELSSNSTEAYIQLDCPVLIKPLGARVTCKNLSNGKIQGYNPLTESWETLSTETFDTASTQTINELTVDTDTYYSKFKVSCNRYSSSNNQITIYDFKIVAGTYKK